MNFLILKRGLVGFTIGVTIGFFLSIIISLIFTKDTYQIINPDYIYIYGSEINATMLSFIVWGLIGAIFSITSFIWENEKLSLFRQTISVFFIYFCTMLIAGYILKWYNFNFISLLIFIVIFIFIFSIIWLVSYIYSKKEVRELNEKIKE